MRTLALAARASAFVGATALCVSALHFGHGGTYRGPGDTVPPGAGGGAGGGSAPTSPGPGAPGTPSPSGPSTPGAMPGTPGSGPGAPRPATGNGGLGGPDLSVWTFWWEFNKDRYLNLKDKIHQGPATSGSEGFWLGDGTRRQGEAAYKPSPEVVRETIVPALLAALKSETDQNILSGALIALARIGDERREDGSSPFEEVFVEYLTSSNLEVRETAAISLGILANDASVPTLRALLLDQKEGRKLVAGNEVHYRTRAFSAYGLGLIARKTANEDVRRSAARTLVEALESDRTATRDLQVAALVGFGLAGLDTVDVPDDVAAEDVSPWTSLTAQMDWVLELFADADRHRLLRAHAPTALARLLARMPRESAAREGFEERIVEALRAPLAKRSKEPDVVVQSSVLALGQIVDNDGDRRDRDAREDLIRASEKLDPLSRRFALIALAQAAGRVGEGPDSGIGVKEAARVLGKSLSKGQAGIRPWAGLAVGVMDWDLSEDGDAAPSGLLSALRTELDDRDTSFPAFALAAALAGDREALPALREGFDAERDWESRGYAAVALGLLNDTFSIEPIQKALEESSYKSELLKQCAIGLGLMGNKQAGRTLVRMLEEARSLGSQAAVATALGFIGDRDSVQPLITLLQEAKQPKARAFAAVSLGLVADKERLPWNSPIAFGINYLASTETLNDPAGTGILNIL
ncbi:MAG: HEAT repeat domain-containing protein [Planctomycetota bacterium]